jgi:hypothetical protein
LLNASKESQKPRFIKQFRDGFVISEYENIAADIYGCGYIFPDTYHLSPAMIFQCLAVLGVNPFAVHSFDVRRTGVNSHSC